MKKLLVFITLFLLTLHLWAQAPVPPPPNGIAVVMTVTNGTDLLTISNGVVIAITSLTPPPPPPAFIAEVASSLGIPTWVLSVIPVKYLVWFILFIWLLPYIGRAWHAWQADGGVKGIAAAVAFGTNVPVALKVQDTGQPVVPTIPVNPGTPPKV